MPLSFVMLGGGYFFRSWPSLIAVMTSISSAMTSPALIGLTSSGLLEDWPRPLARTI